MTGNLSAKELTEFMSGNSDICERVNHIRQFTSRKQAMRWCMDYAKQSGWRKEGLTERQAYTIVDKITGVKCEEANHA